MAVYDDDDITRFYLINWLIYFYGISGGLQTHATAMHVTASPAPTPAAAATAASLLLLMMLMII